MDELLVRKALENIVKKGIKNRDVLISTLCKGATYQRSLFMFLLGADIDVKFSVGDVFYCDADLFSDDNKKNITGLIDCGKFKLHNNKEYIPIIIKGGYNVGDTHGPFWDTKIWAEYQMYYQDGSKADTQQCILLSSDLIKL